jgi:class 3 adenylate cyclase
MRVCDWYGATVNVAARLASEAAPNEAFVRAATRDAARDADAPALSARGELPLRGVGRPVAT